MKHLLPLLIATLLLSPFSTSESHAMEQPREGNVIVIAHRHSRRRICGMRSVRRISRRAPPTPLASSV